MQSKFKVGDKVVFTSYRDGAWGAKCGGKTATVKDVFDDSDDSGLDIEFEDGMRIGVLSSECVLYKDKGSSNEKP